MVENDVVSLSNDNELVYSCAYNFPAVVSVMGIGRWGEMFVVFRRLLKNGDRRVKISLSESLHEIVKIIGGDGA